MLFQTLRNAAKVSASLIACGGRAFHSLGPELEDALKINPVLVFFSSTGIRGRGCDDERRGRAGTYRANDSGTATDANRLAKNG